MFFRMLKKDLKRKKTMNCILFLFIVLSGMFMASSLNNVLTVASGTGYYLDKAGIGDRVYITAGDNGVGHLAEYLDNQDAVLSYRIENVIFGGEETAYLENGEKAYTKNSNIIQCLENRAINYYDIDNNEMSSVLPGHIYASGKFMEKNELKVGDIITLKINEYEKTFIFDGKIKDALLGSDFMGNTRFFVSKEDYGEMLSVAAVYNHYRGEVAHVELKEGQKLDGEAQVPGIIFSADRSTIEMCYVIDMIVAFMMLMLGVCLIIVSFVVLNFSIGFTIREEFREIGIMKAIGLRNIQIRGLYMAKYLLLAVSGTLVGFAASIPLGTFLLKSVSDNMVLGNSLGIISNIIGALLVVIFIILFAFRCTGKVKKATPVDAIRSGQTGERYKKKTRYRIEKSHFKTEIYMALNDIASSPRRFASVIISFFTCTLFVLLLVNTTETMDSPNLIDSFGAKSDLYVTEVSTAMEFMGGVKKELFVDYLDRVSNDINSMGMPAKTHAEVQYKYNAEFNGEKYSLNFQQGVKTEMSLYRITEGVRPALRSEIAITPQISEKTGAKIGDVITIDFGSEKLDCMVTAYFETMNQLGEVVRLHTDAPTDFKYVSSILQTQIDFTDSPDAAEIDARKERLKEYFGTDDVKNPTEYCVDCTGVVDVLKMVQYLLLGITLVVIVLVTILIERTFIANEKSQIAILKAIGFTDGNIISWQVWRFGIVALISALLAAVLSIPMTKLCISPIFGMMGTTDFDFNIVIWKVFGVYPAIVVLATVAVAAFSARFTKKITPRDTASIE